MANTRMDGLSMNMEKESRQRLQSIFPECFSEGALYDWVGGIYINTKKN